MATIQEAMSNSARLLEDAAAGRIAPAALSAEVSRLLSSNLSARGFMAALATGGLPEDLEVRQALLNGIRTGKDNAYELIVKNIIMAGCAAQQHEKSGRDNEAVASRATAASSLDLAKLLTDPQLNHMAGQALQAIASMQITNGEGDGGKSGDIWKAFFDRWGYSRELLAGVEAPLRCLAEET